MENNLKEIIETCGSASRYLYQRAFIHCGAASNGLDVILTSLADIPGKVYPRHDGGKSPEPTDNLSFHWKIIIMGCSAARDPAALHSIKYCFSLCLKLI